MKHDVKIKKSLKHVEDKFNVVNRRTVDKIKPIELFLMIESLMDICQMLKDQIDELKASVEDLDKADEE